MAGELNGTSVFLEVFNTDTGRWAVMAGELSSAPALTNGLVEVTSKSSNSFQEFLTGKGTQSFVLTGDWVFNDDVDFQFVRDAANAKSKELFRILRGPSATGTVDQFEAIVSTAADSAPDGDKVTSNFTLNATGEFELVRTWLLVKNSAGENVKNSAGEQLYSRSDS